MLLGRLLELLGLTIPNDAVVRMFKSMLTITTTTSAGDYNTEPADWRTCSLQPTIQSSVGSANDSYN